MEQYESTVTTLPLLQILNISFQARCLGTRAVDVRPLLATLRLPNLNWLLLYIDVDVRAESGQLIANFLSHSSRLQLLSLSLSSERSLETVPAILEGAPDTRHLVLDCHDIPA